MFMNRLILLNVAPRQALPHTSNLAIRVQWSLTMVDRRATCLLVVSQNQLFPQRWQGIETTPHRCLWILQTWYVQISWANSPR